jgi:SsrA-binding protein
MDSSFVSFLVFSYLILVASCLRVYLVCCPKQALRYTSRYMNLLVNKSVQLHYELLERFDAGIVLSGSEVKSLRSKKGSIKEAYIKVHDDVVLTNAYIPVYQQHAELENYDPYQPRTLLLNKKEVQQIKKGLKQKGHTVVPIRIYASKRFIKIELALAKGKQQHDKRETLKKKAIQRDIDREMKRY